MIQKFYKFCGANILGVSGLSTGLMFIGFLSVIALHSQNASTFSSDSQINQQISLQHDNDFLTLTDQYYSSGLFISYTRRLRNWERGDENQSFSLRIGQEVFTPSDIETTEISEQDRPYVGFLGLKGNWSLVRQSRALDFGMLLGLAGNNSGAGGFQRWYHKIFVVSDPPVWVAEMNNSFHANLYLSAHWEWELAPLPFAVITALKPELAFGTRDQFGQLTSVTYFGRRDTLKNSMATGRLGSLSREIYFSLFAGYRYVAFNGMLEGNALGDNSSFLAESLPNLYYGGFEVHHRFKNNEYRFGYRIRSPEAPGNTSHKFVTLAYARNF